MSNIAHEILRRLIHLRVHLFSTRPSPTQLANNSVSVHTAGSADKLLHHLLRFKTEILPMLSPETLQISNPISHSKYSGHFLLFLSPIFIPFWLFLFSCYFCDHKTVRVVTTVQGSSRQDSGRHEPQSFWVTPHTSLIASDQFGRLKNVQGELEKHLAFSS